MPPGLSSPLHLLVVLVVALIVLGPDELPSAVRKAARFLGELRRWWVAMGAELERTLSAETTDPPVGPATPDN